MALAELPDALAVLQYGTPGAVKANKAWPGKCLLAFPAYVVSENSVIGTPPI